MPYITKEDREKVDPAIDILIEKLNLWHEDFIEGVMNYTITRLLNEMPRFPGKWRYKYINRAIGVLECVKLEFYRRLAGPYEDKAILKNGDIPCYGGNNESDGSPDTHSSEK